MPTLPLPVVVMSAVDVIVTKPPFEAANMPFASVVTIPNGLGSTFSVTLPLLVNSTPVTPDAGAMLLVRLPMLSTWNGPEPLGRLTPLDTLPEQVTIEPLMPLIWLQGGAGGTVCARTGRTP